MKSSVITADSLFGGMDSAAMLVEMGHDCILSCTKSRPSAIFKDYLCEMVSEDGDSVAQYGEMKAVNGESVPFMVGVQQSKRALCTISTAFGAELQEREIEQMIADCEDEDDQQYLKEIVKELRQMARIKYAETMFFVDKADAEIMSIWPKIKKHHYTTSIVIWYLLMLMVVNARRLYQSATGQFDDTSSYVMELYRALVGFGSDE